MSTVYFRIAARGPTTRARAPLLERLLARANACTPVLDWRSEALAIIAPGTGGSTTLASAALRRAGDAQGAWVCIATPVHFIAGMSTVTMPEEGILELEDAEADALAGDFNRLFADDGVRLSRGPRGLLLCVFDVRLEVTAPPPEVLLGKDVSAASPQGADSKRVRRLMSEIEMWLFDHPVNAHRRASGGTVISALWLWGGAPTEPPPAPAPGWTAGKDPLFEAFDPQAKYPNAARPGVVVIEDWPGTARWRSAENDWLAPALVDLKLGRLERIELSARDRSFALSARALRRFWRRAKPWWETLGLEEGT